MAKILAADDEPDILNLIILSLRHAGHEVVTAEDGQAALDLAKSSKPDLILLDVKMPKINGIQVCRLIKAEPSLAHIPVVFLSVRGADNDRQAGFEAGATAYLVKPFAPQDLNRHVAEILAQHKVS